MAISKWNPFGGESDEDIPARRQQSRAPFRQLQREMNRESRTGFSTPAELAFRPRIDVSENDETLKIQAELPGLDKDDIQLEADDNSVTIQGEKSHESKQKDEDEGFYRSERSYGYFRRTIPFPVDVDTSKAKATFRDGVLDVRFPKEETGRGETLEIE